MPPTLGRLAALLLALLLAVSAGPAHAQTAAPAATGEQAPQSAPLTVGVPERAPFATQGTDGAWQGLGVDLWRMVAEDLGLAYELTALPLDGAGDAGIDVALAVDATPERAGAVDYTLPFYTATLAVAAPAEFGAWRVVQNLASWQFVQIVLSLSVLLFLVGAVIWLIERRRNAEQFHARALPGLGDGFWWAGVTLTTIGYGDKAPVTFFGRAVAMLWMLIGLAVSAALTASVVSAVNLTSAQTLSVPGDLADRRIAVLEGSSGAAYLQGLGLTLMPVPGFAAGLEAVEDGRADALAAGAPELAAVLETSGRDLRVSTTTQDPQYVTLALSLDLDEDVRRAIDRSVLDRIASDDWWTLVNRYLPQE